MIKIAQRVKKGMIKKVRKEIKVEKVKKELHQLLMINCLPIVLPSLIQ